MLRPRFVVVVHLRCRALQRYLLHRVVARGFLILVGSMLFACAPQRDLDSQLALAARRGDLTATRELVNRGANVNGPERVERNGRPALFHAAAYGHTDVVEFLIGRGADVNEQGGLGGTALMAAAYGGHTETVRALLRAGAIVNAAQADGWTALANAAGQGHIEVVKLLLARGANVNVRLPDGNTPLSLARAKNHLAIVDLLIRAGARSS